MTAAMSTTTARAVPIHHNRNEIRMRLLNRLGIHHQRMETGLHSHHHHPQNAQRSTAAILSLQASKRRLPSTSISSSNCNSSSHQTPEQQEEHEQTITTIVPKTTNEYTLPLQYTIVERAFEKKPRVQFREGVKVREIPSRRDYGEDARHRMWSGLKEIHENALRNDFEFFVDGENWESCKEEDEFLLWNDELVHPATFERYEQELFEGEEESSDEQSSIAPDDGRPMLFRGESVHEDSSESSTSGDERSNFLNSSNSRKRKSSDDELSLNPLRRSPKVSSFAELSDNSESEEDMEEMNDQ